MHQCCLAARMTQQGARYNCRCTCDGSFRGPPAKQSVAMAKLCGPKCLLVGGAGDWNSARWTGEMWVDVMWIDVTQK